MFARIASPAESNEDTFVARLRSGDSDAFETLYARTFPAAYGAALRVTGNAVDAQDVTQAAFMKAWYLREGLNFASPEGWMVRVARNIAIDVVRRRTTRSRLLSEIASDGTVELESEAMAELDAARVRAALPNLPATERRVIELRYLGSATEAQVAQITGTALGTVKTRTRSGLRRLRRLLGE